MLITLAKMKDKVSIAKLNLLILFSEVFQEALQGSILCCLFLIFIKSNHIVSTVKQLAADLYYLSLVYARTLAGKLNPDLKANPNEHPPCVIQPRSELGSKSYIFMQNDKIILSE